MFFDIEQLQKAIEQGDGKAMPPVHLWQPEREGEIDISIDAEMHWYHEGGIFERHALVKLFSSILRKDGEHYYLVTPAEKLKISVADVPFKISTMIEENGDIHLVSNVEDAVALNAKANWQLRDYQGVQVPYVEIREGLFARVDRHVYYQMVESAIEQDNGDYVFFSAGHAFPLS